ncbi:MAG: transcription termination factor NusA [Lentisphaerae bacterium GWF2_44_16]|nr:MAG: transcription termination factor NusA [Lentisphaerae bacterium GWF2_44_16]
MNNELLAILEYIEQERGINRDLLVDAVESALLSASRKSIHPASNLDIKVDKQTGEIKAWAMLELVEKDPTEDQLLLGEAKAKMPEAKLGDIVRWEVTPKNFGRIAAQTAKQAIMQQLRKAEKAIVREEFQDKIGEIVNGIVRRFESGSIIVDLQKAEGILLPKDKISGEQYMAGDRINALLLRVESSGSGPSLILSRAHADFVKRLFEREVTEIHDGVVQIMGIAREPGSRTKIAVKSNDQRVDPIGACVGMRGMRVKNITNELGGERVDIIRYDDDIKTYASNALQPAKPKGIEVIEDKKVLNVHVTPEQSRLAFGKRAQNVRLCSKLINWTVNIITSEDEKEESFEEKKGKTITNLSEILHIEPIIAEKLVNNGFLSVEGLKEIDASELSAIPGMEENEVKIIEEALKEIKD